MFDEQMEDLECTLNICYYLPKEILEKVPLVYEKMNGWIGYGEKTKEKKEFPIGLVILKM